MYCVVLFVKSQCHQKLTKYHKGNINCQITVLGSITMYNVGQKHIFYPRHTLNGYFQFTSAFLELCVCEMCCHNVLTKKREICNDWWMRVTAGEPRFITNPQLSHCWKEKAQRRFCLSIHFLLHTGKKNPAFAIPAKSNLTPLARLD